MKKTIIEIQGTCHEISDEDVRQAARNSSPEKISQYYVKVEGEDFPPKQLIRLVTKTTDTFNSANARSALTKLGFVVKSI